jgi:hypothetical protein
VTHLSRMAGVSASRSRVRDGATTLKQQEGFTTRPELRWKTAVVGPSTTSVMSLTGMPSDTADPLAPGAGGFDPGFLHRMRSSSTVSHTKRLWGKPDRPNLTKTAPLRRRALCAMRFSRMSRSLASALPVAAPDEDEDDEDDEGGIGGEAGRGGAALPPLPSPAPEAAFCCCCCEADWAPPPPPPSPALPAAGPVADDVVVGVGVAAPSLLSCPLSFLCTPFPSLSLVLSVPVPAALPLPEPSEVAELLPGLSDLPRSLGAVGRGRLLDTCSAAPLPGLVERAAAAVAAGPAIVPDPSSPLEPDDDCGPGGCFADDETPPSTVGATPGLPAAPPVSFAPAPLPVGFGADDEELDAPPSLPSAVLRGVCFSGDEPSVLLPASPFTLRLVSSLRLLAPSSECGLIICAADTCLPRLMRSGLMCTRDAPRLRTPPEPDEDVAVDADAPAVVAEVPGAIDDAVGPATNPPLGAGGDTDPVPGRPARLSLPLTTEIAGRWKAGE